ncbi:MAG: hypothetical protein HOB79_20460 [Rhodospirillaceae bacterium]|jgi:hypothetical protein|nr:hypothetical protein [Rhodospirillales bacterium]MBT3906467.1 hypothetical protein [Rhodospirillaceae bacterium]MBT4703454.1 hypothetical protein [Rhodospirillaceae bacterium]MBT5034282.1 hypothetical protein [Rhodospirillaceae bacterium]MBT6218145.1 hypothetical protein [Rhodospirillaceae bacterium]
MKSLFKFAGLLSVLSIAMIFAAVPAIAGGASQGVATQGKSGAAASASATEAEVGESGDEGNLGRVATPVVQKIMAISYTVAAFGKFEDSDDIKSASALIAALTTKQKLES